MAEFEAITTQEAFDTAIKARLERNTRTVTEQVAKQYEGWLSPEDAAKNSEALSGQVTELTKQLDESKSALADLTAKAKASEISSLKMRSAFEAGLPFELAERLSGETAEEILADAEKHAKFTHKGQTTPQYNSEKPPADTKKSAYMDMLAAMKK